jgi:hypothetical protein
VTLRAANEIAAIVQLFSNSHFGFCGLAVGVIERRVSGEAGVTAGVTAGLVAAWQTRG